ncbi:MAG: response regulator [Bryobacteraceae bacterium]|nr:response regulator [Bryobacteraceae bacterium]
MTLEWLKQAGEQLGATVKDRREGQLEEEEECPTILILDHAEINRRLLRSMLRTERYRILEARHPNEALALIRNEPVDLVILDLVLTGMSGPEFCRALKSDRRSQLIPILMLTSVQGAENEIEGIESGADEYLLKPVHPAVLRSRVRAMVRHKLAINTLEEAESILFALAQAIEQRDAYTAGHCERLACYSVAIGMALGLPRTQLLALHRGGFLHDIGKISIPDAILHKPGPLTAGEWALVKRHPIKGEEICSEMKSLRPVLPIIRSHHERWDGSGYPDGLRGKQIPLVARILQLSDIYDALTTARPYKPALTPSEALGILTEQAKRGWRDPELVEVFGELHRAGVIDNSRAMFPHWPELTSPSLHAGSAVFAAAD